MLSLSVPVPMQQVLRAGPGLDEGPQDDLELTAALCSGIFPGDELPEEEPPPAIRASALLSKLCLFSHLLP